MIVLQKLTDKKVKKQYCALIFHRQICNFATNLKTTDIWQQISLDDMYG